MDRMSIFYKSARAPSMDSDLLDHMVRGPAFQEDRVCAFVYMRLKLVLTVMTQTCVGYIRRNCAIQAYIRTDVGHCCVVGMCYFHASYGDRDVLLDTAHSLAEFTMVGIIPTLSYCPATLTTRSG